MECYVINEGEMKILISAEELEAEGISVETLNCSEEKERRWLRSILHRAREITGKQGSEHMRVKCFPKAGGGCALYVSGWCQTEKEKTYFLFPSLDHWLRLYSLLPEEEREKLGRGSLLSSGAFVICYLGEKMDFYLEFATPLTGEYLSFYLSEHQREL